MKLQSRRGLGALAMGGAFILSACSGGTTPSGKSTFAQIQAQIASVRQAIDAANTLLQQSAAPTIAKQAAAAATALVDSAADAVANINSTTTTGTITTYIQDFVDVVRAVLPLITPILNLNPATAVAANIALAVIEAFVGNVSLPVILPPAPSPSGTAGALTPAPMPIPLPTKK